MADIYFLKKMEDVIGTLFDVANVDGHSIATVGNITVAIPEELVDKLSGLKGERIGILRDDQGGYRLKIGRR